MCRRSRNCIVNFDAHMSFLDRETELGKIIGQPFMTAIAPNRISPMWSLGRTILQNKGAIYFEPGCWSKVSRCNLMPAEYFCFVLSRSQIHSQPMNVKGNQQGTTAEQARLKHNGDTSRDFLFLKIALDRTQSFRHKGHFN